MTADIVIEWPSAEKIRAFRLRAGLTQKQAAQLVGLGSSARWNDYEGGRHHLDAVRWFVFQLLTDQHPTHQLTQRALHG